MLVSAVHQSESAICIHISPASRASPSPFHPVGHHRAPSWAPCAVQQPPSSHLPYTWQCICVSATLPVRPTLPFSACVHTFVLYIYISVAQWNISHKRKEVGSFVMIWMDLESVLQRKVSQKEKKQISYINAHIWNLEKWYWWTYLQSRNRDADVENGLVNTEWEERVWRIERVALAYVHDHV